MCKVYNQVGSLTTVKTQLHNHGIKDFQSINELISFQKNYSVTRQQIISDSSILIKQEKEKLKEEIELLADFIETCRGEHTNKLQSELDQLRQELETLRSARSSFFERITSYLQKNSIQSKIRSMETHFDSHLESSLRKYTEPYFKKKRRFEYIDHNFDKAVQEGAYAQLRELERKKSIIDELSSSIYGAIGEKKVSVELEHLSDDFVLINDFSCSFHPPIYNRQTDDYIKSVQIDHILVGPAGVFLIETKNWSEQSMNSLSLRSPVDQIRRTNFALYITLNKAANSLLQHHWGERKIPIKNLIVMINQKPIEEFQHVKVLTLKEIVNYIEYFKPIFSVEEVQRISDFLRRRSNHNY